MISKDIKDFVSGAWIEEYEYKSFLPEPICIQWLISNPKLMGKLGEADRCLGRLDAFSELIPDIDFFIKMHITKEATVSSKIEGTQTSFQEALVREEDIYPEKRDDWKEVHSYIKALNQAIEELDKLPLSSRLIKNTHKILLEGVRGREKMPGEYRTSQNWIGTSLKNATFIPPNHENILDLMTDLEKFIHVENMDLPIEIPHLIRIAMIHYQFETIHPFLDGNGRMGRLLITLYLIDKKLLRYPTLYLSDYFERNRHWYYENLTRVRAENDLTNWLSFFLDGVIETSKNSIETFQNIIKLREDIELKRLTKLGKKQTDGRRLLHELYKQPIMEGGAIAQAIKVHPSTANRLIRDFQSLDILQEITGYKRNRIYAFREYIELF